MKFIISLSTIKRNMLVVDEHGKVLGEVAANATKKAAALLGCSPVQEFRIVDGVNQLVFTKPKPRKSF